MTIIAREVNGSVCYGDVKLLTETTEAPTVATDAD
jgi:ribosomal protein S28E/S33